MTTAYFDIDSLDVERQLAQLDTAISPVGLAAFLTGAVGPWLQERAEERFAQEGDDVSGKWSPLRPATQEIRARGEWPVSGTGPINVRTSELERYITGSGSEVWPHGLGASLRFPGKQTSKKSIVEKMRTAQQGRANPRTVARPVLGMNEQDLAFVTGALMAHVNEAVR